MIVGATVLGLCITFGPKLRTGPDPDEIAARDREYAAGKDQQARDLARQVQAHIGAGRFGQASFILPEYLSDRDALARYIPLEKSNAIRAVAGISLWPRPQDGKAVDRLTLPFDMYSFLPGFYKTVEAPLTEREQRLVAFGQMTRPTAREEYDVPALSAWFTTHLGVNAEERQFLFHEKVQLPASRYDVDREQWMLPDLTDLVPAHIGSVWLKSGRFGFPGRGFALVPVNRPASAAKAAEPVVIPMRYDDARCQEMIAYFRFYPVAHGGAKPPSRPDTRLIDVHVSEIHLYCKADKKLLWSQTL